MGEYGLSTGEVGVTEVKGGNILCGCGVFPRGYLEEVLQDDHITVDPYFGVRRGRRDAGNVPEKLEWYWF